MLKENIQQVVQHYACAAQPMPQVCALTQLTVSTSLSASFLMLTLLFSHYCKCEHISKYKSTISQIQELTNDSNVNNLKRISFKRQQNVVNVVNNFIS